MTAWVNVRGGARYGQVALKQSSKRVRVKSAQKVTYGDSGFHWLRLSVDWVGAREGRVCSGFRYGLLCNWSRGFFTAGFVVGARAGFRADLV